MPGPNQPIRTGLAAILQAVRAQLVSFGAVSDPSRVRTTVRDWRKIPHWGAEHDIILRPSNFLVDKGMVDSNGRQATLIIRTLTIVCRTRLHLDEAGQDKVFLEEPNLGHLVFEEKVCDALQIFMPTNSNGDDLLTIPMRIIRGDSIGKEAQDAAWGQTALDWEIRYLLNLNQAIQ